MILFKGVFEQLFIYIVKIKPIHHLYFNISKWHVITSDYKKFYMFIVTFFKYRKGKKSPKIDPLCILGI